MENLTSKELNELNNFVEACDSMITGKFILADVKIRKIVQSIEESEYVYKIINNCLLNFNFEKELQRAEVRDEYSGSQFIVPTDKDTLIALAFCLLVSFDTKRIDFYDFIKKNFETLAVNGEYTNFAKNLMVPFKEAIVNYYKSEQTNQDYDDNNSYVDPRYMADYEQVEKEDSCFDKISDTIKAIIEKIYVDRKIKEQEKQELLYVLKSIEYCLKYEDMRLVASYITCFNNMAKKVRSVQFLLEDIKNIVKEYYEK